MGLSPFIIFLFIFLLSVRVTIPPPLVYQTSALPNELTDNFCSPGRLRSDSLHYVTVTLPRLSYKTIFAGPVGFEPTSLCLTGRSFAHLVLQTRSYCSPYWIRTSIFALEERRPVHWTKGPFAHWGNYDIPTSTLTGFCSASELPVNFVGRVGFEPTS